MKRLVLCLLLLPAAAPSGASAADGFGIGGYAREMPILWTPPVFLAGEGGYRFDNILHGRVNLRWTPRGSLRAGLEIKCRLITGESPEALAGETDYSSFSSTYFDLTRDLARDDHAILAAAVDRAWLDWTKGPVEITAGRQRIAWGTCLVWNPIDLFNPFSPLDFDNEERPGTDAGRLQWYLAPNAKVELAAAPRRSADSTTAAMLATFNRAGYDWVVVGGRNATGAVLGAAWAGSIRGGGFRGEVRYDFARAAAPRASSGATASIDADYTFPSTLYLHAALLYRERGATGPAGGARLLEAAREGLLTPSRLDLFGEIARDLNPLLRGDCAAILNPSDRSWYLGPSLAWSVVTDLDLTAQALLFGGASGTEFGDLGEVFMLRVKYSF
jgi:hypothetical protein